MIRNYITKYLKRSNSFNDTKLTKIRKYFHNTIIRKFTFTFIKYRSSFNRIDTSKSSSYSITFINLRFIFPFNTNITSFFIQLIIFFYNSLFLKTKLIYKSKNTLTSKTFPNYMPNFIKITITSTRMFIFSSKQFTFFISKLITNISIMFKVLVIS